MPKAKKKISKKALTMRPGSRPGYRRELGDRRGLLDQTYAWGKAKLGKAQEKYRGNKDLFETGAALAGGLMLLYLLYTSTNVKRISKRHSRRKE